MTRVDVIMAHVEMKLALDLKMLLIDVKMAPIDVEVVRVSSMGKRPRVKRFS